MDREAAFEFLKRFLEKRGVGPLKDLDRLIAMGKTKGFFKDPEAMFEVEEWHTFGDCLWDLVIDDDKTAKKLMKPWRDVINCMKKYKAEKHLAAAASDRLEQPDANAGRLTMGAIISHLQLVGFLSQ